MILITDNSMVTKHFMFKELMCPCCGKILLSDLFYRHMKLLEIVRREVGFPITINSGFRCEKHNRRVGGAKRSMHLLFATDIRPSDADPDKLDILDEVSKEFFTGCGRYGTFIHRDLRKRPYTWDNR